MPAMFLDQFRDFMIMVLIAAAVISGIVGELSDTIAIIVIVVLNAVVGILRGEETLRMFLTALTLGLSTIVFFAVEVEKWIRRKRGG
jgi:magnesium-transporting ATPase (P-type)